jgi:hypothetical protein
MAEIIQRVQILTFDRIFRICIQKFKKILSIDLIKPCLRPYPLLIENAGCPDQRLFR